MTKKIENEGKLQFLKPFGPSIAKVIIPENIIIKLNDYFENTIKSQEKLKKYDVGKDLAGNVSKEIGIDRQYIKDCGWLDFLAVASRTYIHHATGKIIKEFSLIDSWIVSQFKHEYNPTHWHSGHLSGAGYIKVPDTFGEPYQKQKNNFNGQLQLIHGSRQFLSHSTYSITPKVGEFYIFPNYLMHTVFPFTGTDQERRSISFNANIDPEVYNVYRYG